MKDIIWNKAAKEYVQELDKETRIEIGSMLRLLQEGCILGMPQSRHMPQIHRSAFELRIRTKANAHRVIYVLCLANKIIIPHAFIKKSQKTASKEIETAKKRLKEILYEVI